MSKSWRVDLLDTSDAPGNTAPDKDVEIVNLTGDTTGTWSHKFVANHAHTRAEQPVAAVGTFNAKITNLLHLTGAFGVHRRSTSTE